MVMPAGDEFSSLEPDPVAIRRHLDRLFTRCATEYPDGRCEIAWTAGAANWAVNAAENFPVTPEGLDKAVTMALLRNREGRNVYVGVNPRKPGIMPCGRSDAADVEIAFFQFCECDKPDSLRLLQQPPIPFSIAVITGTTPNKRPHCYYELAEPVRDMALWRSRQEMLRDRFKGDSVVDPPRIMRLAGTVNYPAPHKVERGYQTELVTIHTPKRAPVTSEEFNRAYGVTTGSNSGDTGATDGDAGATDSRPNFGEGGFSIKARLAAAIANNEWHNNVLKLIAHMVWRGDPDALILALAPALTVGLDDRGTPHTVETTVRQMSEMLVDERRKRDHPNTDTEQGEDDDWDAPPPPLPPTPEQLLRLSIENWLERDVAKPDFLLGELLSTTGRGLLVAPTGLGKTNFAMAMTAAMTSGQDFLHWHVPRASRVLYIDGEMSERLMRGRVEDAVRRAGGVLPEGFLILNRHDFPDLPPLNTAAGQRYVDRLISGVGGVDQIVFDNIQALLVGSLKDDESWQPILPWAHQLTRRSIGQLWVHHTGIDEGRSYGDKTKEWQLDVAMLLKRVEMPLLDIAFELTFTKARERGPRNRNDFASATIVLRDDVWQIEGESLREPSKPASPVGQKFHAALLDAISVSGTPRPQSAGHPSVTKAAWEAECTRLGLVEREPENRKRALLSKYCRELIAINWIACNGDFLWNIK